MSDKVTLYETKHEFTIDGLIEDMPVYRSEDGKTYVVLETKRYEDVKEYAYPLLVDKDEHVHVDNSVISKGYAHDVYLGKRLLTGHTRGFEVSPLTWEEHTSDTHPLVYIKRNGAEIYKHSQEIQKLQAQVDWLRSRLKVLTEELGED